MGYDVYKNHANEWCSLWFTYDSPSQNVHVATYDIFRKSNDTIWFRRWLEGVWLPSIRLWKQHLIDYILCRLAPRSFLDSVQAFLLFRPFCYSWLFAVNEGKSMRINWEESFHKFSRELSSSHERNSVSISSSKLSRFCSGLCATPGRTSRWQLSGRRISERNWESEQNALGTVKFTTSGRIWEFWNDIFNISQDLIYRECR